MSARSWTPGPWKAGGGYRYDTAIWAGDTFIAATDGMTGPVNNPNQKANARLIAAAPELYDALEALLTYYVEMVRSGDCGSWDPELDDQVIGARAALAKARGK